MIKTAIDALFAGIMIAISTIIYLVCANSLLGAFIFSIGLVTIILCKFNLYTGKVGYARTKQDIKNLFVIFIMNLIGCLWLSIMGLANIAFPIILFKLNKPLLTTFI